MDVFRDSLPDGKRLRARQGLNVINPSGRFASGKENLGPLDCREPNAPLGKSRSPLPDGFLRAPLQDITDVLYPPNMQPEGELPGQVATEKRGQRRKKTRKDCSILIESTEFEGLNSSWEGLLARCSAPEVAKTEVLLQGKVQTEEVEENSEIKATETQVNSAKQVKDEEEKLLVATKASNRDIGAASNSNLGSNSKGVSSLNTDRDSKRLKQSAGTTRQVELKGRGSVLKFR